MSRNESTGRAREAREALLQAAGEVFAEAGYEAAGIRAICARAGANVAAVNYHFGGKEALYQAVLEELFASADRRAPRVREDASGTRPEEAVGALVQGLVHRLFDPDGGWRGLLFARELASPSPFFAELVSRHIRPTWEHLESLVARLRPELSAEERRLHVAGLIGQCVFLRNAQSLLLALYGRGPWSPPRTATLARHVTDAFLHGLGLHPPTPAPQERPARRKRGTSTRTPSTR
uniref:Helix-turn-helix transcriptional regulator n=1 Tax=Vitiosangium cumulatum TaxID=1867796 RepID=A0A7D4XLM6_9BACT|nr:helix-turn-helix transcriptional regulator [Vitiosangium cumulatum]